VPKAFATPRTGHLRPLRDDGNGQAANGGNGHRPVVQTTLRTAPTDDLIRQARLKGYEGDPCTECGQLTLVRSGACCKCDTCGASSGCS
jgi:ribonucleoside-diphosphate reductase alpha chain